MASRVGRTRKPASKGAVRPKKPASPLVVGRKAKGTRKRQLDLPELEALEQLMRTASDLRLPQAERQAAAQTVNRAKQLISEAAKKLRDQFERSMITGGIAARVGDNLVAFEEYPSTAKAKKGVLPKPREAWRDIRTGKFVKTPEGAEGLKQVLINRRRQRQEREEATGEAPIVGAKELKREEVTRVRVSFVITKGTRTECTASGFIARPGFVSTAESVLALAAAFQDAVVRGGGFEGFPPEPWYSALGRTYHVRVNGDCAGDLAGLMREFAESPTPNKVQKMSERLYEAFGISFNGELTISWREQVTFKTQRGNERIRMDAVPERPARRFVFGAGVVVKAKDEDLGRGLLF